MSETEPQSEGLESARRVNSHGWQRRLLFTILIWLVLAGFIALAAILPDLTRPPHLVYPLSVQATMDAQIETLQLSSSGQRPFNDELLKTLMKQYGLEDCQVGGKYGALCQDGTYTRTGLLREDQLDEVCSQNGGVKEWIECR